MNIYIFSDNKELKKNTLKIKVNKKYKIKSLKITELKKSLKAITESCIVYIDITALGKEKNKTINYLSKKDNVFHGIINYKDPSIETIPAYYFSGAIDYINKKDIENILTEKRLKQISLYLNKYRTDYVHKYSDTTPINFNKKNYIVAENGWNSIISDNDYTFAIMFIELDGIEDMKKNYGKKNLQIALSTFRKYIEKNLEPFGGRIWMWSGFGGLILFPFNGKTCQSIISGFRIILFKYIYDVEDSLFPHFISFRIAQLLGTIKYKKCNTGNIISENLNSIFHLGRVFAKPGQFYITEEMMHFSPKPLKMFFNPVGKFENQSVYKMRLPVHL